MCFDERQEKNGQEKHKVAQSELGYGCTGCLEHFARASDSVVVVVVVDKSLYHAAARAVADVLAVAGAEAALHMVEALIRKSCLREVVEENSSLLCSSLVKP